MLVVLLGAAPHVSAQSTEPAQAESSPEAAAGGEGSAESAESSDAAINSEATDGTSVLLWSQVADVVVRSAPTVTIADLQLRQAELRRLEAQLASLPSIGIRAGIAPAPEVTVELDENGNPIQSSANESDVELATRLVSVGIQGNLDVTLPLTTFGKIQLARQLASVGVDVEQAEREGVILESLFEAYRAYTSRQWYTQVSRLTREAEHRLNEAEEDLEDRIFDGDSSARATLRRLTIGRTAFVQLKAAADTVGRLAEFGLSHLLGYDVLPGLVPFEENVPTDAPPTLEDVLAFARVYRPDYRLLNSAVRAGQLRSRLEARQFAPDIALNMNFGGAYAPSITNLRGPFIFDPYNRFGFGFAVGLRWAGNPFMRSASIARFNQQEAEAVASRDAAWFGIELEVSRAYFELLGKRDIVLAFAEAREAAEAWMNQAAFQYDQGLSTFDDLREPLQTFYETEARYYQALLEYHLGVADLAVKCGSRDMQTWPAWSSAE